MDWIERLDQYLDYKCFMNFSSRIILAVYDSKRKFMLTDVGAPGIQGDATLFRTSLFEREIANGEWETMKSHIS